MINSRDIDQLTPEMANNCRKFIALCKENTIDVIITSTYRDFESQNVLFAQGRTTKGRKVTNAKGGQSYHNYRIAFDFVPTYDGKAIWDDAFLIGLCGQLGKRCNLEWAGDWKRFTESLHLQLKNVNLKMLMATL